MLAEAFYLMGEVEKYGTGFIRIRDWLKDYPELTYQLDDSGGMTRFEIGATGLSVKHDADIGEKHSGVVENVVENVVEKRLTIILDLIHKDKYISSAQIAKQLNITSRTAQRDIEMLKKQNRIKRIGPAKGGHWKIL